MAVLQIWTLEAAAELCSLGALSLVRDALQTHGGCEKVVMMTLRVLKDPPIRRALQARSPQGLHARMAWASGAPEYLLPSRRLMRMSGVCSGVR